MNYKTINNISGWIAFVIALTTYVLTLEPSASYWDCGEFISAAYKLQVVHQPGAPLFLMIGKIFSLLSSDPTKVAYWVNIGSATCSATTILFLFWTITALGRKFYSQNTSEININQTIVIIGAGFVGALAYAFSDTFWFSAVEAEVYAMSSLFTAVVFWAILKWEAQVEEAHANKWILFIAYVMGLSIGVHLLNLLAIPAIAILYYFKKSKKVTNKGIIFALLAGIIILAFVQYGVIQYSIKIAAYVDLFFVNNLGLGFGSGVLFFIISLTVGLIYGISYSIKKNKPLLNLALLSIVLIIFGYSSYVMIVVRAKANTTLNNSQPDNAFSLLGYLNREQYGDSPLIYGQYFDSKAIDTEEGANTYRKGDTKYEISGKKFSYKYDRNTLFPRMYSDDPNHVGVYRDWMELGPQDSPTFATNLGFFATYQVGFMYMRYFMWNFVGRQNDDQGIGDYTSGNWISGINFIDALRLGDQNHLPESILKNKAHNKLYFLPLIIGLIGAIYQFRKRQKEAGIVALLFFFTGLAIVLYLNQTPIQPRERDYAYAGSFYAFTIWIGLAVFAINDWILKWLNPKFAAIGATIICLLVAPILMASQEWDDHNRSEKVTARDLAKNYLNTCAPNAILFTYGDNDTYPLWYVQEVENFRPDVRIVNLSLFDTDWYINQLRLPFNQSKPLPITMKPSQYVTGVRDVVFYQDYKLEGAQNIKDVFEFITSENPDAKVQYQSGKMDNFLPTKDLKMDVDINQLIKTNTINSKDSSSVIKQMVWQLPGSYVSKGQIAILDILLHNNWERPIYFAFTVPSSNFMGLDNYLFNEGFALRLIPKKKIEIGEDSPLGRTDMVNSDEMFENLTKKFVWGNMKNASYLDQESSKMVFLSTNKFTELAKNLISEGKTEKAREAIDYCLKVLPIYTTYESNFALSKYELIGLMYQLGMKNQANTLTKQTLSLISEELDYNYNLSKNKENLNSRQIQLGLFVLNELKKLTNQFAEPVLNKSISDKLRDYQSKFGYANQ